MTTKELKMNTIAHYLDAHSHLEEHVGRVCLDLVEETLSSQVVMPLDLVALACPEDQPSLVVICYLSPPLVLDYHPFQEDLQNLSLQH